MWRVVLAVWAASVVVFLPVRLVLWTAVGRTLASLPAEDLPDGELPLIVLELIEPVWIALAVAALSGWLALWAWTVLWHAGVVRWLLLSGRIEVRLAEVLGHGLMGWWRWARLGATSLGVLLVTHSALWWAAEEARRLVRDGADDSPLGVAMLVALASSVAAATLCWLATLRGSWLLGVGDRRSAVVSWLAGLGGSLRQPFRSTATLALWAIPGFAAMLLPLVVGWRFEVLRGGLPGALVEVATGLLGAFCWVGLFLSFAPVTGLVGTDPGKRKAE